MKIAVFVVYDGVGGTTYNYAPLDKADDFEKEVKEGCEKHGLTYDRRDYASVYDFLSNCEEVCDDSFTDGEALEYVLEVLGILEI